MASNALDRFYRNARDTERIIQSHGTLNHDGGGRRALGHLTRAGVLLLCASWELYSETVMVEALDAVLGRVDDPQALPLPVRKRMSDVVKDSKHELSPIRMAGDGWKGVLRGAATVEIERLNTPNSQNLDITYRRYLGVDAISDGWSEGAAAVDRFVTVRGDIAHRGRDAGYVTINNLREHLRVIRRTAIDIDNFLPGYVRGLTNGRVPWNRTTV